MRLDKEEEKRKKNVFSNKYQIGEGKLSNSNLKWVILL